MVLKVNFSDNEASSEALDFTPIPSGKYHVKITDGEMRECGPESKNAGKPYWNLEFTVQEGPYEERKLWGNIMLFEGALFSLSQLMKALGNPIVPGKAFTVPEIDDLLTKDLIVTVRKMQDSYRMEKEGSDEPLFKNEIKGYSAYDGEAVASGGSKKSNSLLP
jgi:hypothetical protein